ncbi:MAG: hypothetical protein GX121_07915 [Ignavibacteria bacterium]|jgi:hypothetical protein|nr:hypothetical protein [Ignavibacteria bacterium]
MTRASFLLKFIAILLLTSSSLGLAQIRIDFSDAAFPRAKKANIFVEAEGNFDAVNEIKIVLKYNSYVIDILKITGSEKHIIGCSEPDLIRKFDKIDSATIEFSCNEINAKAGKRLFDIEIEGLASPDSLTYIFIESIYFDGKKQVLGFQKNSKILVQGSSIFQQIEGMGLAYPNPFFDKIYIPFALSKESNVDFYIYSASGSLIFDKSAIGKEIIIRSESGNVSGNIDLNKALEKGRYIIEFAPRSWSFSTARYYFLLKTDRDIYSSILLYVK